jgi:hypothetical protein
VTQDAIRDIHDVKGNTDICDNFQAHQNFEYENIDITFKKFFSLSL